MQSCYNKEVCGWNKYLSITGEFVVFSLFLVLINSLASVGKPDFLIVALQNYEISVLWVRTLWRSSRALLRFLIKLRCRTSSPVAFGSASAKLSSYARNMLIWPLLLVRINRCLIGSYVEVRVRTASSFLLSPFCTLAPAALGLWWNWAWLEKKKNSVNSSK